MQYGSSRSEVSSCSMAQVGVRLARAVRLKSERGKLFFSWVMI